MKVYLVGWFYEEPFAAFSTADYATRYAQLNKCDYVQGWEVDDPSADVEQVWSSVCGPVTAPQATIGVHGPALTDEQVRRACAHIIDKIYTGPRGLPGPPPTDEQVEAAVRKVMREAEQ